MKYLIFFFTILFFSCEKNSTEEQNSAQLHFIKSDGKIEHSFAYNDDNLLIKENKFYFCDKVPSDEFFYIYTGTKLDTIKSVIRSRSSSSTALCDPAYDLYSYAKFDYDNQNRLSKIIQSNDQVRTFQYNAQGFIEKQTISFPGYDDFIITYKRDAAGNMIEQTDSQGNKQQYEFDNKINPYYLMKKNTDIITAHYNSPNNVVKIKSANSTTEIRYEYNRAGLPVKMFDSNGSTYEFVYR